MSNIFEGAKFGDKFLIRKGKIIIIQRITDKNIYYCTEYNDYVVNKDGMYYDDGTISDYDIVSRYQEPFVQRTIDENKLDELANNWNVNYAIHPHMEDYETYFETDIIDAFKYGYRKAMEE